MAISCSITSALVARVTMVDSHSLLMVAVFGDVGLFPGADYLGSIRLSRALVWGMTA